MNETDAVSCLLCLQADEYGSMIKVCVPLGAIPPSPERVICRRCVAAITEAADESSLGDVTDDSDEQSAGVGSLQPGADPVHPDHYGWDSDLPDREVESLVEADRSEPENATGSSKKRSPRRVASEKTDD